MRSTLKWLLDFLKFSTPFILFILLESCLLDCNSFLLLLDFNTTLNTTLKSAIKITTCLVILILIRGCIPRYRYDFLTKMGWIKFLGYMLVIYWVSTVLFLIW